MRKTDRKQILEVVKELYYVIQKKNVSPNDEKTIAEVFPRSVNDNNENGFKEYMKTGLFTGSPPDI